MKNEIFTNTVIEWINENPEKNEMERVLWLNYEEDAAVVISLNHMALPVWKKLSDIENSLKEESIIKRTIDPLIKIIYKDEELPKSHIVIRDEAWEVIKDIVTCEPDIYIEKDRWKLIRKAAKKIITRHKKDGSVIEGKTQPNKIYKYLRRYWKGGKTKNALLPNYGNCGAPGKVKKVSAETKKRGRKCKVLKIDENATGINVTEDIRKIFEISIKLYYENKNTKPPLSEVYKKMVEKFFNKGFLVKNKVQIPVLPPSPEIPSIGQFVYWFHKERDSNFKQAVIAREGKRAFPLRHRENLGNATFRAFGPGSVYEIDATIGDVFLVNGLMRWALIGRPVIYVVIDVLSRLIAGLHIALEGPSWRGAALAIANAAMDKVAFCARYGIQITNEQWPARYLPESICGDRGEMISKNSDRLANNLNITISNTPPYRADWKPIVEQSFRILNLETIHWLPGATKERERERGERDYRLDAVLDIREFTKIIINNVLAYNSGHWIKDYPRDLFMIQKDVDPIPNELWKWGIIHKSGHLREKSQDIIRSSLLPRDTATITDGGINFNGIFYTCPQAEKEQWFVRAKNTQSWKEPVYFDPRKMDNLYLFKDGRTLEVCNLLKKSNQFGNFSLEEIQDYREIEDMKSKLHETAKRQAYAESNAMNDAIIAGATKKTQAAIPMGMSKHKRIENLREHRKDEKERIRQEEDLSIDEPVSAGKTKKDTVLRLIHPKTSISEDVDDLCGERKKKILDAIRINREQKQ